MSLFKNKSQNKEVKKSARVIDRERELQERKSQKKQKSIKENQEIE